MLCVMHSVASSPMLLTSGEALSHLLIVLPYLHLLNSLLYRSTHIHCECNLKEETTTTADAASSPTLWEENPRQLLHSLQSAKLPSIFLSLELWPNTLPHQWCLPAYSGRLSYIHVTYISGLTYISHTHSCEVVLHTGLKFL